MEPKLFVSAPASTFESFGSGYSFVTTGTVPVSIAFILRNGFFMFL